MANMINWFETIDSTNSEALRQVSQCDDFTVFAAKFQTGGRGQKGTKWESAPGENLTFSVMLKPKNIKAQDQFIIAQVVTVGIRRYLKERGVESTIKWPNDIYAGDKKICGILIENFVTGDTLSGSIVGIGLNVNQTLFQSDAPNPVSMSTITEVEYDIKNELVLLSNEIKELYKSADSSLSAPFLKKLEKEYMDSLYRREGFHLYQQMPEGEVFKARISGIDSSACLILEREDGGVKRYSFKEIKYII